jgi:MFS family permease
MLLGPILGPVIGGLIVSNLSWRWIFYVNVPIAVVAVMMAARILSPDSGRADAGRADAGPLDWRGFVLLSPALVGIVFGLSEIETRGGIGHPLALGPPVAGIALVAVFARYSLHAPRPIIDVGLFRGACFRAAATTTFFLGAALFGTMLVISLYYQVARGTSALTAGLLMAPQGAGAAAVMPLASGLTDRVGGGRVALFGVVVLTIGTLPLVAVGGEHPICASSGLPRGAWNRPRRGDDAGDGHRPRDSESIECPSRDERPECHPASRRLDWNGSARGRPPAAGDERHHGRERGRTGQGGSRPRLRIRCHRAGGRVRQHLQMGARTVRRRALPCGGPCPRTPTGAGWSSRTLRSPRSSSEERAGDNWARR